MAENSTQAKQLAAENQKLKTIIRKIGECASVFQITESRSLDAIDSLFDLLLNLKFEHSCDFQVYYYDYDQESLTFKVRKELNPNYTLLTKIELEEIHFQSTDEVNEKALEKIFTDALPCNSITVIIRKEINSGFFVLIIDKNIGIPDDLLTAIRKIITAFSPASSAYREINIIRKITYRMANSNDQDFFMIYIYSPGKNSNKKTVTCRALVSEKIEINEYNVIEEKYQALLLYLPGNQKEALIQIAENLLTNRDTANSQIVIAIDYNDCYKKNPDSDQEKANSDLIKTVLHTVQHMAEDYTHYKASVLISSQVKAMLTVNNLLQVPEQIRELPVTPLPNGNEAKIKALFQLMDKDTCINNKEFFVAYNEALKLFNSTDKSGNISQKQAAKAEQILHKVIDKNKEDIPVCTLYRDCVSKALGNLY